MMAFGWRERGGEGRYKQWEKVKQVLMSVARGEVVAE
jgi:hypothetical protein